jgi:RNA polymerase sigma factor (sigma-70 family)
MFWNERRIYIHVKKINKNSAPDEFKHESNEDQLVWLMEEYGDMVIRLAYTYVKQKQLAEDISQEVFISCYQNLDRFEKKAAYKTWLYRITVNKCKDALKSWSFRNIFYKEAISSIIASGSKNMDSDMVELEEKEMIFKNVISLPIKLREAIILHYYEELSIQEIAELLNLSPNTVKTRLHRARHSLKSVIKEGEYSWKIN